MRIALDFDGTLVSMDRPYDDVTTPLEFLPGALDALRALKAAGHVLLLYSARANRALLEDPELDPLVRAGARKVDLVEWARSRDVHQARYDQMLAFASAHLVGLIDAVDDGRQGKPSVGLFIDDRAVRFTGWAELAFTYGPTVR